MNRSSTQLGKNLQKLLALILAFALAASTAFAAAGPDPKHVDKIKHKVADCLQAHRRVHIETYDHRLFEGFITQADADTFILSSAGASSTLAYSDVLSIKWPSGAARQAKALALAAVLTGVIFGFVVLIGGTRG
jgi:hypothetical protein